jgi:alanyl-tRNA synthetase
VKIVAAEVPGAGANVLRQLIDRLRRKAAPIAVMLGSRQEDDKVMLVAGLSRDLVERGLDAVAWIRDAASVVRGGGGGRADMAQAGGKLPERLPEALETARAKIQEMLRA